MPIKYANLIYDYVEKYQYRIYIKLIGNSRSHALTNTGKERNKLFLNKFAPKNVMPLSKALNIGITFTYQKPKPLE